MMNKILGSILLTLALSLSALSALAAVNVSVDKTQFYPGDTVYFTISASGGEVSFPTINTIDEYPIIGNSSSQSINVINGKTTKIISKSYSFKPTKSLTIPAFSLTVNNQEEFTQTIEITQLQPKQNTAGDDFILELKTEKNEFFAGEYLDLQVVLHRKKSASFSGDINVEPLQSKGLEFFTDSRFVPTETADYVIYTAKYRIRANTIGSTTINPAIAILSDKVLGFGGFFNTSKQRIYSNALKLNVLPLPNNLTLYGDFSITGVADKQNVKSGEVVNVDVRITGEGNTSDIEQFVIDIPGTTIYTDEPTTENNTFVQKFAIIAEQDFQIPSFELAYFDKTTQQSKTLRTKEIDVVVTGALVASPSQIEAQSAQPITNEQVTPGAQVSKSSQYNAENNGFNYLYLIASFTLGALVTVGIYMFKNRVTTVEKPIVTQIKRAKNDKELFHILLPLDLVELSDVVEKLEANVYRSGQHTINKKEIIAIVKNL